MLRLKTWIWAVGLLFSETFILCVLWNTFEPNPVYIRMLETFLPGFKWLSMGSVALGLVESFLYGAYLAVNFVLIHNFLHGRHQQESTEPKTSKKAA